MKMKTEQNDKTTMGGVVKAFHLLRDEILLRK